MGGKIENAVHTYIYVAFCDSEFLVSIQLTNLSLSSLMPSLTPAQFSLLTLKVPIATAADDIHIFFSLLFRENKT